MLKFIFHIFRSLGIALLVYIPLTVIWAKWDYKSFLKENIWYELDKAGIDSLGNVNSYGHMFSRMREVQKTKDVDVLVIGSSQAYRGFDPRIFEKEGIRIFNMGSSNQTPVQSDVLLRQYTPRLNPKTVIYVVYPEVFSVDGVESTLDILANDRIDPKLMALVVSQKNLKLLNTMTYGLYRQVFGINDKLNEKEFKSNDLYVSGGFVEKKLFYFKYDTYREDKWNFNDQQFSIFHKSLRFLHKKGIKVILVQTPTASGYYNSFSNNDTFDSLMNNSGSYYNFNHLIELDDSLCFYDRFHMNKNGVVPFNKKFLELLGDELQ